MKIVMDEYMYNSIRIRRKKTSKGKHIYVPFLSNFLKILIVNVSPKSIWPIYKLDGQGRYENHGYVKETIRPQDVSKHARRLAVDGDEMVMV